MITIPFFHKREEIKPDPEIERALNKERGELHNNAAALQAGSRILRNMAGAMHLMVLAGKMQDDN